MQKDISEAVVRRLPRYYRYLSDLLDEGVERISSGDLSDIMKVTASQIRQDLNNFGGFGQQGYGYNVRYLHEEIGKILGVDRKHSIIVIGAGDMGQALAKYTNFERLGFFIIALFDIDPELIGGDVRGLPIYDISKLPEFVRGHNVDIAVMTVPKGSAEDIAEMLTSLNIHAILNFAHLDLDLPDDVVVENVHLSDSLMRLSYHSLINRESLDGKE